MNRYHILNKTSGRDFGKCFITLLQNNSPIIATTSAGRRLITSPVVEITGTEQVREVKTDNSVYILTKLSEHILTKLNT